MRSEKERPRRNPPPAKSSPTLPLTYAIRTSPNSSQIRRIRQAFIRPINGHEVTL